MKTVLIHLSYYKSTRVPLLPCHALRVCKLQPMGQIHLTGCFCVACKLRSVFTFLNSWKKKSKEEFYVICGNYMKFKLQRPQMNFY